MTALNGIHPASPAAPAAARGRYLHEVIRILAGVALLTVSARIALPAQPVPITAQTLAVMLVGALLGSRRGALAVLAFLGAGAVGLPVFAYGGGVHYFFGPTAGYLVGFVPAAFVIGSLVERGWGRRGLTALAVLLIGDAIIFAFGLTWMAMWFPDKFAWLIFMPGEMLKIAIAAVVLTRLRR